MVGTEFIPSIRLCGSLQLIISLATTALATVMCLLDVLVIRSYAGYYGTTGAGVMNLEICEY